MSLGKKKAVQAVSPFSKVSNFTVDYGDFGKANSSLSRGGIQSTYTPSSQIKGLQDATLQGLQSNLNYISQSPEGQYLDLLRGQNPYYNLSRYSLEQDVSDRTSQALKDFSRRGLDNSTTAGSFQAQLANQASIRDLFNQTSAMDYLNTRASNNVSTNQRMLDSLTSLAQIPTAMTNSNLYNAFADQSTTSRFNADQQNRINMQPSPALQALAAFSKVASDVAMKAATKGAGG